MVGPGVRALQSCERRTITTNKPSVKGLRTAQVRKSERCKGSVGPLLDAAGQRAAFHATEGKQEGDIKF